MTAQPPPNPDEPSRRTTSWEQLFSPNDDDSSNDESEVEELAHQRDIQLIRALSGHPDYRHILDDPSKFDRQRLDDFQAIIDELIPAAEPPAPLTSQVETRPGESPDNDKSRSQLSHVGRLLAIVAGIAIAMGIGLWRQYQSPQPEGTIAGKKNTSGDRKPDTFPELPENQIEVNPAITSRDSAAGSRLADVVRTERTSTDSQVTTYARRAGLLADRDQGPLLAMRDVEGTTDEQHEAAIEQVERSLRELEHKSDHTIAELITLGNWHLFHRRPKTATRHFRAAIERSPDTEEAWFGIGVAYLETSTSNDTAQLEIDLNKWILAHLDGKTADAKAHMLSIRNQLKTLTPR